MHSAENNRLPSSAAVSRANIVSSATTVSRATTISRMAIGMAQGLALYGLFIAARDQVWPASNAWLYQPLLLISLLLPPMLITGLPCLRRRRQVSWMLAACLILALLALYGVWRAPDQLLPGHGGKDGSVAYLALTSLHLAAAAGFFVGHALVLGGAVDGRGIAGYPAYFEVAWRLAIQLLFSALFTLVFWLVLTLGGSLLELVKIDFLIRLMNKPWFAIPVTVFACACGLHVTDVHPAIVQGIRSLLLSLLSWLLPLAALIAAGFVACLPWTGLAPLWATQRATLVLLCVAAVLVVLINAAYQDGCRERQAPLALRLSHRLAACCLPPLVAIAAYALGLRVSQYGWSTDRVILAGCLLLFCLYAVGYAWCALRPGSMAGVATVNIGGAFLFVALLLALYSPLADPARIAVNNQVARLLAGRVEADRFDYAYLARHGGRHGRQALERLKLESTAAQAARIRDRAALALTEKRESSSGSSSAKVDVRSNLRVWPAAGSLPPSFLAQDWARDSRGASVPACLTRAAAGCDAFLIDFNGDGRQEILLISNARGGDAALMVEDGQGKWRSAATLPSGLAGCEALSRQLARGDFKLAPSAWRDLQVGAARIHPEMHGQRDDAYACPEPKN
jgi:hypothetical protein